MGGMNEVDILRIGLTLGFLVTVAFGVKFIGYYIVRKKVKGVDVQHDDVHDDDDDTPGKKVAYGAKKSADE